MGMSSCGYLLLTKKHEVLFFNLQNSLEIQNNREKETAKELHHLQRKTNYFLLFLPSFSTQQGLFPNILCNFLLKSQTEIPIELIKKHILSVLLILKVLKSFLLHSEENFQCKQRTKMHLANYSNLTTSTYCYE